MLTLIDLTKPGGRDALDERIARLRRATSAADEHAATARAIIEAVARDGDDEVVRQMRKWTDPDFTKQRIRVDPAQIVEAEAKLSGPLREAIDRSIEHVRTYQRHIMPTDHGPVVVDGAELGLRFTPVDRVGLTIPGGSAPLFSSIIMLAVPAIVAGVAPERIAIVHPPPYRTADAPPQDISPIALATCGLLGVGRVYRIGGPAAVAALAMGTEAVEPVDLIVGPGHPVVAAAQGLLRGVVGTGDYYGASEIVTVADESADARCVASDLIAQAEHDPGKCFLVAWSAKVIETVQAEVRRQLPQRNRRPAIESALQSESCAILVGGAGQAVEVVNALACEHLNLAVAEPDAMLGSVRHAGEIFLGAQTPVAAGDYYAGPSHTLPTDTTARFASGVSVYTFLKRTGTIQYRDGLPPQAVADIAAMAEAEGLDGHAASVRLRGT